VLVKDSEDVSADSSELVLDLDAVLLDLLHLDLVALCFFLLLDGRHYAPRSPSCPDHVLVGHGEQVALLDRQLNAQLLLVGVEWRVPLRLP